MTQPDPRGASCETAEGATAKARLQPVIPAHERASAYPPVLGQPCPCDREGVHEPVLLVPLPVSVTAMSRMATALDKMLAESGRHGVFLADGHHPAGVIYAVPS